MYFLNESVRQRYDKYLASSDKWPFCLQKKRAFLPMPVIFLPKYQILLSHPYFLLSLHPNSLFYYENKGDRKRP